MSPKKAAAVTDRRSQQALDIFERAAKALGKHEWERARAYRAVCERALVEAKKTPFRPKGFEDLLNHGVFLHNRGEFEEALKVLRQAAEIHPKNEHVLYCLAATSARAGDSAAALKALRSAIAVSPANRAQARGDSDFDPIREDEEFIELVHPAAS